MLDWLLSSIDPSRGHEVGFAISWHARLMTLAWGVLVPAAIFAARYMKIVPGQDWPRELDNKTWWHFHWMGQALAYAISLIGLGLVLGRGENPFQLNLHTVLGYVVLAFGTCQVLLGIFRGSKGGPTARATDGSLHGDHYDMTPKRLMFERVHRSLGYLALLLGMITILVGMWNANAPRWMWVVLVNYWMFLVVASVIAQIRGNAVDTYQAIWGPDPSLPGNKLPKMGWRTVRPSEKTNGQSGQTLEGAE
ncbi:cytochrome b561 domain-containing protein [Cognatishimia activa]|uniref:Eukaryotic cytochrome b561 n=1 Tax=Cognatishimia activa TaxID=1715691 RepID=A0A0N7MBX8_9RHOB|nr:cytochrome b561 domain-containing protein [Cognatishimia activa]CUI73374.1 Eukaryotic cytochrome b561 [Cognatishimia activa]CUK26648.1 Eukaryotic cytochrome b561 [Cognatishimia activa]